MNTKLISKYPRVLIIYHSCINKEDQHGVSIREWFADWPKENLAQIYSGGEVGNEKYCGFNFKIGPKERTLGQLFFKIKGSSLGQSSYTISLKNDLKKVEKIGIGALLKNKLSEGLLNTGLWELIFKPTLSKEMTRFVKAFNPDVIYCQGYSLTFTWLPVMIRKKFNLPICFQTGDDWPFSLYRTSPLLFIKPIVKRAVQSLLSNSSARLANGKLMAEVYEKRYNMTFEPLMMCDDPQRFNDAPIKRIVGEKTKSIVYTGNLGHGRWNCIVELCEAVRTIKMDGYEIMVTALATTIPPEAVNTLQDISNLQILPALSHSELPSVLKGADILFLPETFDPVMALEIRLSISTKAHFYMMSQKPILVYASLVTGIADYAKEQHWAHVVEHHDLKQLATGIEKLLTDKAYSDSLISKGNEVFLKNHAEKNVRKRFLHIFQDVISPPHNN